MEKLHLSRFWWQLIAIQVWLRPKTLNAILLNALDLCRRTGCVFRGLVNSNNLTQVSNLKSHNKLCEIGAPWKLVNYLANDGEPTSRLTNKLDFDAELKVSFDVYFYERNSDGIHRYEHRHLVHRRLIFPIFRSNDYLVLVPDIQVWSGTPRARVCLQLYQLRRFSLSSPRFVDSVYGNPRSKLGWLSSGLFDYADK